MDAAQTAKLYVHSTTAVTKRLLAARQILLSMMMQSKAEEDPNLITRLPIPISS